MSINTRLFSLLLGAACFFGAQAAVLDSLRLSNKIDNGIGAVDLLKDLTPAQLEAYRIDNQLILAAHINESGQGTETSNSQGVAIKDASLKLKFKGGATKTYSIADGSMATETRAWIMEKGAPTRLLYYTLLGGQGVNRDAAVNNFQKDFDATLKIKVPDNLSSVTSAVLSVTLLTTDSSKGDPEAYYDFSGGPEDLAILTPDDAAYLDKLAPGRLEAPIVDLTNPVSAPGVPLDPILQIDAQAVQSWNYFPSAETYYIAAYEDFYPNVGDYDFNDLVVAYQVKHGLNAENKVVAITGTAYILARGAMFSHDWHLRLPLPETVKGKLDCIVTLPDSQTSGPCSDQNAAEFAGTVDITMFADTVKVFSDPKEPSSMPNTARGRTLIAGPRGSFQISLVEPVDASTLGAAPFDPYLYVRNTGKNIQLLEVNPSFKDENGNPFGMLMPSEKWSWPLEQVKINTAYPAFSKFVESRGQAANDWFANGVPERVFDQLPASPVWAW